MIQDEDPHLTSFPDFPSSIGVETTTTTTSTTTTSTRTVTTKTLSPPLSTLPLTSPTKCPTPTCPPSSLTCPPCKDGFVCRLDVIASPCQCPVASCVKPDFDTGVGNGSSGPTDSSSSKSSIVALVVGGLAGFIVIALITLLIFRQRRQRRTANNERLLSSEGHLEEAPDPFKPQTQSKRLQPSGSGKSWCESTAASSHKDVIRIAYIPSLSSEESIQLPELAALSGPQASFMASINDIHTKHTSVASSMSTGTLDEAFIMAVSNKATPQLLRLHNIKKNNSDMIQRSNSLHSSNSIKRTKSQRRVADANKSAGQETGHSGDNFNGEGKQLYDALEQLQAQQEEPDTQYTPAVMVTGPSARSSAQSTVSTKRGPNLPSMVLEPRPLHPSYHTQPSSASPVTPVTPPLPTSAPQTIISHSASAPTALASLLASTSTTTPTISTVISTSHSAPPSAMRAYPSLVQPSPSQPTGAGSPIHLSQSGPNTAPPTRDSTFSTLSDSRSTTTRGEGEEIMIFWDGHRGSRTSNL
ncbi:MAG: hypothetical protein J3R72DRAFT_439388 [Linnemannia gamsii]|nr:MAG: hypothetical protein J3R72DRAFT_439388 [Linnemannia gamsii]